MKIKKLYKLNLDTNNKGNDNERKIKNRQKKMYLL